MAILQKNQIHSRFRLDLWRPAFLADPDRSNPKTATAATATSTGTPTPTAPPTPTASAAMSAATRRTPAAPATMPPAATMAGRKLHTRATGIFLVEDVEGREANVGNFFLTEQHPSALDIAS